MTTVPPPDPPVPPVPRRSRTTRRRYWHRYPVRDNPPPGEDLAALRAGLGRAAGTVPSLWQHYTSPSDGEVTSELEAEHGALSLYGLHQQGQSRPMHRTGTGVGAALRALRGSGKFSHDALDRRVAAAVNATTVPVLLYRLRGLIPQLRAQSIPLDYDQLTRDLRSWSYPESRQRVRRSWGLAYYTWEDDRPGAARTPAAPPAPDSASDSPERARAQENP
ncbi:type I-E CRISPR-associated protein Cse2/CasB [Streptomyces sp. NPDC000594]|uniref:type I-E CRISPR-associated protein Cse2/CasB n=1 Tax=Streptomyces sp. NPDC000594 TaxID=3154261 RepID=UPI00331B38E3